MTDERGGSVLHQQALTVMGFFTGLTLTALVLILNSPSAFRTPIGPVSGAVYFQILATYVAMVGSISSVGIVAFLEVAGGMMPKYSLVDQMGTTFFLVSVFGFMGILPLLLAPFTRIGALLVLSLEIFMLASYFVARRDTTLRRPRFVGNRR